MVARIVSFLCLVIQALQGVITIKLAASILDINEMKQWVLLAAIIPYVSLFDFGVTQTIIREISISDSNTRKTNLSDSLVRSLLQLSLIVFAISIIFTFFLSGVLGGLYIATFIAATIFRLFSNMMLAIVFVKRDAVHERTIRLMGSLIYLLFIYISIHHGYKLYSLSVAVITQSLFYIVLAFFCCKSYFFILSKMSFNISYVVPVFPNLKDWTLSSIPSLFVFNFTIYSISTILDAHSLVEYSILYQLFFGVLSVCGIPVTLASPQWSKFFSTQNNIELEKKIYKVVIEVTCLSFLGCAFLIAYGNIIIPFIKATVKVVEPLTLFSFSLLIITESIQTTLTYACFSCRQTNYTKITIIAGICSVCLSYMGAELFGVNGAVIGMLLSQLVTCGYFNTEKAIRYFLLNRMYVYSQIILSVLSIVIFVFLLKFFKSIEITSNNYIAVYLLPGLVIVIGFLLHLTTSTSSYVSWKNKK